MGNTYGKVGGVLLDDAGKVECQDRWETRANVVEVQIAEFLVEGRDWRFR